MNNIGNFRQSVRMPGLATGLDTASMVKDMMRAHNFRVSRLEQDRTVIEWRQDAYRDVIGKLQEFRNTFFDIARPERYMLNQSATRTFDVASSNGTVVTAVASAEARSGTQTVNRVIELARPPMLQGETFVSSPLSGQVQPEALGNLSLTGRSFALTVDGVRREIAFNRDYNHISDMSTLVADLNAALVREFGVGRVVVTEQSSRLTFAMHNAAGQLTPSTSALAVHSGASDALGVLGLAHGQSNRLSLAASLDTVSTATAPDFSGGSQRFSINNVNFDFAASTTIGEVMRQINRSAAGVTMTYNSMTDSFALRGAETGAHQRIAVSSVQGNLLSSLGLSLPEVSGTDALLEVNGQTVRRGQNTFAIDGLSYTLHSVSSSSTTISVNENVDRAVGNVRDFVAQYNEVLDMLNGRLREERDPQYLPLTREQRQEMSDEEVQLWEERARRGLLRNSPLLERLASDMRRAVSDALFGGGISLASVGVSSRNFFENGRLHIDENRLRQAIATNGEQVSRIFSQASEIAFSSNLDAAARSERRATSGAMWRLSDVLADNVRTSRDSRNRKGLLLEQAGITGDSSASRNVLSEQMTRLSSRIEQAEASLRRREDIYWRRFATLERAMNSMNAQSAWLVSQFSPNSR